jgi:hypothetical protein
MQRIAALSIVAATIALVLGAAPGHATASDRDGRGGTLAVSTQDRDANVRKRPRTQLRVHPRYTRRNYHTLYVLPYDEIAYPGPNAVRHCVSRLVQEHRPSGTVIVPRMRCWWAPR